MISRNDNQNYASLLIDRYYTFNIKKSKYDYIKDNQESLEKNEVNLFVKIKMNSSDKEILHIKNLKDFKLFLKQCSGIIHEYILYNRFIHPYFDIDHVDIDKSSDEKKEEIHNFIKYIMKDIYNIEDPEINIFHRITYEKQNHEYSYRIIVSNYKVMSELFFHHMRQFIKDNKLDDKNIKFELDNQVYSMFKSIRHCNAYKFEHTSNCNFRNKWIVNVKYDTRFEPIIKRQSEEEYKNFLNKTMITYTSNEKILNNSLKYNNDLKFYDGIIKKGLTDFIKNNNNLEENEEIPELFNINTKHMNISYNSLKDKLNQIERYLTYEIYGKSKKINIDWKENKNGELYIKDLTKTFGKQCGHKPGVSCGCLNRGYKCRCLYDETMENETGLNKCHGLDSGPAQLFLNNDGRLIFRCLNLECIGWDISEALNDLNDIKKMRIDYIKEYIKNFQKYFVKKYKNKNPILTDKCYNKLNYLHGGVGSRKTGSILYFIKDHCEKTNSQRILILVPRIINSESIKNKITDMKINSNTLILDERINKDDLESKKIRELFLSENNLIIITVDQSLWKLRELQYKFDFSLDLTFIDEFIQVVKNVSEVFSSNKEDMLEIRDYFDQIFLSSSTKFISDVIFLNPITLDFFKSMYSYDEDDKDIDSQTNNSTNEDINIFTFGSLYQCYNKIIWTNNKIKLSDRIENNINNDIPMLIWCDKKKDAYEIKEYYFNKKIQEGIIKEEDVLLITGLSDIKLKRKKLFKEKYIISSPVIFSSVDVGILHKSDCNCNHCIIEKKREIIGIYNGNSVRAYDFINACQRCRHAKTIMIFSSKFKNIYLNTSWKCEIYSQKENDKKFEKIIKSYNKISLGDALCYIFLDPQNPDSDIELDIILDKNYKSTPDYVGCIKYITDKFKQYKKDFFEEIKNILIKNNIKTEKILYNLNSKKIIKEIYLFKSLDKMIDNDDIIKNTIKPNEINKINDEIIIKQTEIINEKENFVKALLYFIITNKNINLQNDLIKVLYTKNINSVMMNYNYTNPENIYDTDLIKKNQIDKIINNQKKLKNSLEKIKEIKNKYDKRFATNNFYKILQEYINKTGIESSKDLDDFYKYPISIKYDNKFLLKPFTERGSNDKKRKISYKPFLNDNITNENINSFSNDELKRQIKYEFYKKNNGRTYIKERDLNKFEIIVNEDYLLKWKPISKEKNIDYNEILKDEEIENHKEIDFSEELKDEKVEENDFYLNKNSKFFWKSFTNKIKLRNPLKINYV